MVFDSISACRPATFPTVFFSTIKFHAVVVTHRDSEVQQINHNGSKLTLATFPGIHSLFLFIFSDCALFFSPLCFRPTLSLSCTPIISSSP